VSAFIGPGIRVVVRPTKFILAHLPVGAEGDSGQFTDPSGFGDQVKSGPGNIPNRERWDLKKVSDWVSGRSRSAKKGPRWL
jgi:hypothetical protein